MNLIEKIDHTFAHCKGTKCKLRKDCLRYIAHKDAKERQLDIVPYLDNVPYVDDKDLPYCNAYYPQESK